MEKSAFFNSSSGDRVYSAEDFASYFKKLVSNGIFYSVHSNLQIVANGGMGIKVMPGSAWINGYSYENTEPLNITIDTADGVNPRIDRIVLRLSAINRNIRLAVLKGSATASPTPTSLTRNNDTYELALADITVPKGANAITPQNINDTRLNSTLCGTVNSLISAVYE